MSSHSHLYLSIIAALTAGLPAPVLAEGGAEDAAAPWTPAGSSDIEQTAQGARPPAELVESFDGIGDGFTGPQGMSALRNPSDNTLAVGPNHIMQIVNTRVAVFTKKGEMFDETGRVLYGAGETRNFFKGFGGPCERLNNGDAVARYDQLAERWLVVMPIFRRLPPRGDEPAPPKSGEPAQESVKGRPNQPGPAAPLFAPPPLTPEQEAAIAEERRLAGENRREDGSFAMCYAISATPDPLGPYYRYEFVRPLFPDYPRPAIWPDGYYTPTSTGDDVIEKHACVVEREKMLRGKDAAEQCVIIDGANFLNNADLDGQQLPPPGAPNIMMATGGAQLNGDTVDDGVYYWNFSVNWDDPSKTKIEGPSKIPVAPYRYLCDGQLSQCAPQPGVDQRLDSQGDKIMARLVYRRIGEQESIVAVHSVNTSASGGGVRWYEFRLDGSRAVRLHQQGAFAPDANYRWLASPAIDANGNIGIGYTFGGPNDFPGQRFAGRLAGDPLGLLTLREHVLVAGESAQTDTNRWEDYTQTAIDPVDDCTIWYVGDYYRKGAARYSTRIGAYRFPGCPGD